MTIRQKSQKDSTHESLVKEIGKFYSPRHSDKDCNRQTDLLNELDLASKNCKRNLSKEEWVIFKKLEENPEIIIKHASKGGAITVATTSFYKSMIYEHLTNNKKHKN